MTTILNASALTVYDWLLICCVGALILLLIIGYYVTTIYETRKSFSVPSPARTPKLQPCFCAYSVCSYDTGDELIRGIKFKDLSRLVYDFDIFTGFLWHRRVSCFHDYKIIKGELCKIIYFCDGKFSDKFSCVFADGYARKLRGKIYMPYRKVNYKGENIYEKQVKKNG